MHIVIVGGGAAGLTAARKLERKLGRTGHSLTLVSTENVFLYQSLLSEAAGGTLEPRHVVVPLRSALQRTEIVVGEVERVEPAGPAAAPARGRRRPVRAADTTSSC